MNNLNRFEEGEILYECLWCGKCDRLAQQYWRLVFNTIRKTFIRYNFPHTIEDIEDIRIHVFIKLFENNRRILWKYDERRGSSLASWIILITTRIVINHIRDTISKNRGEAELTDEVLEEINQEEIRERIAELNEEDWIDLIREAIKMLSSRDILIIKLFYYDGLSSEDCAYILGISKNTFYKAKSDAVKVRLAKTITDMLKKMF